MAEYVMEYDGWAEGIPAVEYLKVRSAMHARKREEIVRCRDCAKSIGGEQCMRHKSSGWSGNTWVEEYEQVDPDGFCAWGERRDA